MKTSEQINEIAPAFIKAQSEVVVAVKDSKNPMFDSKYASIDSVWDACKDALHNNDIATLQGGTWVEVNDHMEWVLETCLLHTSGQFMSTFLPLQGSRQKKGEGWQDADDPQAFGSSMTYMCRYALVALMRVPVADDDGNKAQKAADNRRKPQQDPAPQQPKQEPAQQTPAELRQAVKTGFLAIATDFSENISYVNDIMKDMGVEALDDLTDKQLPEFLQTIRELYGRYFKDMKEKIFECEIEVFGDNKEAINEARESNIGEIDGKIWSPKRIIQLRKYWALLIQKQADRK